MDWFSRKPTSRVGIDFSPLRLDPFPLFLCLLPIPCSSLQPFGSQTLVDICFRLIAATYGFVEKAPSVTFIEDCHDFFTTYE